MVVRCGGEKGNILLYSVQSMEKRNTVEEFLSREESTIKESIYIYELEVGIKGIVLAVIRQPMRVLQLLGRQFGSQQTRATSSRHDGYKLCRWPIYIAAILANSTRSLLVAEIPTYVRTYVREKDPRKALVGANRETFRGCKWNRV